MVKLICLKLLNELYTVWDAAEHGGDRVEYLVPVSSCPTMMTSLVSTLFAASLGVDTAVMHGAGCAPVRLDAHKCPL